MSTSSARPAALEAFTTAAAGMDESLASSVNALRAALDDLRATEGWPDFLGDVPPLDIDLAAARGRLDRLAAFVGDVGDAFQAAGHTGDEVATVADSAVGWRVPDLGEPPLLVQDGDRWIVSGSDRPDHIRVIERDGRFLVVVGTLGRDGRLTYGDEVPLTAAQAAGLTIRAGVGDDVVELPPGAPLRITVWAGDGDDLVRGAGANPGVGPGGGGADRILLGLGDDVAFGGDAPDEIYGGDGRDTIDGQDGADRIIGGDGFDTLYGGRDEDVLVGGRGADHLEGGSDADLVDGGSGDDVLSGGRGGDVLWGGRGDDTMFGGRGVDVASGGEGRDAHTGEADDIVLTSEAHITLELEGEPGDYALGVLQPDWMTDAGYDAWLERIDSDLELLRTTPSGRAGLDALDAASRDSDSAWKFWDRDRHVLIVPYGEMDHVADGPGGTAYAVEDWLRRGAGGLPGNYASPPGGAEAHDALVSYGGMHSRALDDRPPVASLYHELSHSYDQLTGGTENGEYTEILIDGDGNEVARRDDVPRAEINSVGRDLDGDGDIDTRPSQGGEEHPEALTENALRRDLGWAQRPSYVFVPDDDEHVEIEVDD